MPDIFVADRDSKRRQVKTKVSRSASEYSTVMAEEKQTHNPLASFAVRPSRVRFETQEKKEKLLLLLRRHIVTNVPWMLITIFGMLVPWLIAFLPIWELVPDRFQLVGAVIWYLLVVGYVLESFLTWYFNVYIVTDERIIDIDFYSLIYKEFSAAKIDQIQDVTFTQGGVVAAMFNFGTIYVQTAGEKREFDFEDVPQPRKVAMFLNEMILEEEKEKIEGRVR